MFFGHFVLLVCNLLEWSQKVFQLVHSTPSLPRSRSLSRYATLLLWGGALRDDTKNGCEGDYSTPGLVYDCHIDVFRLERPLNSKTLSRIFPRKFPIANVTLHAYMA